MNYSELKQSHDELADAMRRHNEQAQNMVNKAAFEDPEETVRAFENMPETRDPILEGISDGATNLQKAKAIIAALKDGNDLMIAQLKQRNIIEQARESLRRGDYAGAGRILDSWK